MFISNLFGALILFGFLGLLALAVFIEIQIYMNDPRRKELNDEWFDQFLSQMKERYRDPELRWRMRGIETYFAPREYHNNGSL